MKKKLISGILIIGFMLGIIFLFKYVKNNFMEIEKEGYNEIIPQEEISDNQLRQTKINLYFKNKENGEIEKEARSVDAKLLIDNPYLEVINLLLEGPKEEKHEIIIPEGCRINDCRREKNVLILNLSEEILNFENDETKDKIVKSIVQTFTEFTEIEVVKILVNGEEGRI